MSDGESQVDAKNKLGMSLQERQNAKKEQKEVAKTAKTRKDKMEDKGTYDLQQESLLHQRYRAPSKVDFVEGQGEINKNTMNMFTRAFEMIWKNRESGEENQRNLQSTVKNMKTDFRNFRDQMTLEREDVIRD